MLFFRHLFAYLTISCYNENMETTFSYYISKSRDINFRHSITHKSSTPLQIPAETHNLYELLYIKSTDGGKSFFTIDANIYNVESGDLILVRPHTLHRLTVNDLTKVPYERYVLQFSPELITAKDIDLENVFNILFFKQNERFFIFNRETLEKTDVPRYFDEIANICKTENPHTLFYLISAVLQLSSALYSARSHKPQPSFSQKNVHVERIISYINKNIFTSLNLKTIADDLFLNQYYMSHLFSKHMGISLKKYINTIKIYKAKELIDKGESPTNVALHLGFEYYSTFFNAYRSIIGANPTER